MIARRQSWHGSAHRVGAIVPSLLAVWCVAQSSPAATQLVPEHFSTIQGAIDASASGDTVLIAPGTYRGVGNRDIEFRGRDVVVRSKDGPEVTILDCEYLGRGFYVHDWETRAARIEGLTILHGFAPPGWPNTGGAICCELSSPTIDGCRLIANHGRDGGALYLLVFYGVVDRCVIVGNHATQGLGGGVFVDVGEPEIRDCVITGNVASRGAGIAFGSSGPNRLTGCTIAGNRSESHGGGIWSASHLLMDRCILWGNCAASGDQEMRLGSAGADIRCSLLDSTGVSEWSNIDYDENCLFTDPIFCDPEACGWHSLGDWSLSAESPCAPESSPCGELIGALGVGCYPPPPTGACCMPDHACFVLTQDACEVQQGNYVGDNSSCEPDPCQATPTESVSWGQIKACFGTHEGP